MLYDFPVFDENPLQRIPQKFSDEFVCRRQLEKNSVGCYTVVEPHSHVSCMKKSEASNEWDWRD